MLRWGKMLTGLFLGRTEANPVEDCGCSSQTIGNQLQPRHAAAAFKMFCLHISSWNDAWVV